MKGKASVFLNAPATTWRPTKTKSWYKHQCANCLVLVYKWFSGEERAKLELQKGSSFLPQRVGNRMCCVKTALQTVFLHSGLERIGFQIFLFQKEIFIILPMEPTFSLFLMFSTYVNVEDSSQSDCRQSQGVCRSWRPSTSVTPTLQLRCDGGSGNIFIFPEKLFW